MRKLFNRKNILFLLGAAICICFIIVFLCLIHNKEKFGKKNNPDIESIYFRIGSSSVNEKYEFNKSGNEYFLKYESFDCGKKDNRELKIIANQIDDFIYNENVVNKDYYEENKNEGAYNKCYYYTTKSGENVYLKISENTKKYFRDLIKG